MNGVIIEYKNEHHMRIIEQSAERCERDKRRHSKVRKKSTTLVGGSSVIEPMRTAQFITFNKKENYYVER